MARGLRLESGIDVLNTWAETARHAEVLAVAEALFAIVEREIYRAYLVIDDPAIARELVVVVRDDLALRIRLEDVENFGIVFIGSPEAALEPREAPATETSAGT